MPTGAGSGAGPFHSQSNEAWFTHTPGLKVVYPSTPFDAKGLLLSAIADPNPVMFFEHKGLYRSVSGPVPQGYYRVPIGKGAHVVRGDRLTIVTYGMGVRWASALAKEFPDGEIGVIDLRTLLPLDWDIIAEAVQASHRVVVLHEDTLFGGIGGEIAAWIGEHLFAELDAPVARVGSLDTPVPFHPQLEASFLPLVRLREAVKKTLSF
jgi:2-oxoisovalerate dehydrogenase E1 component